MHRGSELSQHVQRPLPTYVAPSTTSGDPPVQHHIRQAIPVVKDTHRLHAFSGLGHRHAH